jgi:hypothetical protein
MKTSIFMAGQCSFKNRNSLQAGKLAGCYSCLKTFKSEDVKEWTDSGETAICPHCQVDAVLSETSGFAITEPSLKAIRQFWFEKK